MRPKLARVRELFGAKVAAELLRHDKPKPQRPVPQMRRHAYGWAKVSFKVQGRRRVVYLGPWGSAQALARYRAFVRRWPRQLNEPLSAGKWPARRMLTHAGRTQPLSRWAAEFGLKATTLRNRLDVQKLPLAEALARPNRQAIANEKTARRVA